MAFANGLYYRLEGSDQKPTLVLSHSLGCDHGMWDLQVRYWIDHFRILRYDTRGHGASEATAGDYSIPQLGADVLGLLDALGIPQFAFLGLSLGGMTGQWVAAHAPHRVTALVLANTSPKFADVSVMETRRKTVLADGMAPIVDGVMARFFRPETLALADPYVNTIRRTVAATQPAGYAGCCAAVRDLDNRALLAKIQCPTLIVCGDYDVSTPWAGHGDAMAQSIPNARAVHFPAAHLSNIECPRGFASAVAEFLLGDRSADGITARRSVLGDAHVDRSLAAGDPEFQQFLTRFGWGGIWTRPGLDWHTRRLLVIATTAAMGRWEEFRLHVKTGLAPGGGLEFCELREVLLQCAVYAGLPCANTGFKIAAEILDGKVLEAK